MRLVTHLVMYAHRHSAPAAHIILPFFKHLANTLQVREIPLPPVSQFPVICDTEVSETREVFLRGKLRSFQDYIHVV